MSKVFFNEKIEKEWSAQNGAKRRTLLVANKLDKTIEENKPIICRIGFLNKGNHSFIFVNEDKFKNETKVLGVFVNSSYGYSVVEKDSPENAEIFTASSFGGYGNSESKIGIYKEGTLLKIHTYKNRTDPSFCKLTQNGWQYISFEEYISSEKEDEVQYVD